MYNEWTKEISRLRTDNDRLRKAFDSALKMRNEEHAENKAMLEALKYFVDGCAENDDELFIGQTFIALTRAKAAITKAEGK